jgi:nucleoid-associated protein YgaU
MSGSRDPRPSLLRPVPLAVLAATCVAAALGWYGLHNTTPTPPVPVLATTPTAPAITTPATTSPAPAAATPTAAAPPPAPPATQASPRFDIARIGPDGSTVIAGRAQPNATVTVMDGDQKLGETQADRQGNFVFLPATPLAPGPRALHLNQRTDSGTSSEGAEQLVLVVPPRNDTTAQPPLAVLTAPNTAPVVLQQGAPAAPTATTGTAAPPRLGLAIVDYDAAGDISFAGSAPPGATLRAYVDNQPIGTATADRAGNWGLHASGRIAAGEHKLRLDQIGPTGAVTARVESPFRREARVSAPVASTQPGNTKPGGSIVVQPGDSLWLLARNVYGAGPRYTAILSANRAEIREPNLIYPGQVLLMPAEAGSSTATSSNRSR